MARLLKEEVFAGMAIVTFVVKAKAASPELISRVRQARLAWPAPAHRSPGSR